MAKKRFHQSAAARLAESRGEERHLYRKMKSLGAEPYAGMEPRRRQEMEDAGMIHEDHSQVANMPQYVMYKAWPKGGYGLSGDLDDTIGGVDKQMDLDGRQLRKNLVPKKY